MRRVLVMALVAGFAAAFAVAGFPALAASVNHDVNATAGSAWDPSGEIAISVGDTVTWKNPTGNNHGICVNEVGQTSGCAKFLAHPSPGASNWSDGGPVTFDTDNATYQFVCTVHSFMQGTVKVGNGSPTTTTDTTPTTTSGTNTTPTTTTTTTTNTTPTTTTTTSTGPTLTTLTADTTAPRFTTRIKRRSSRRVLKLTFGVSEDATLSAILRRRPPGKKTYSFVSKTTKAVTAGSNTVSLLRAGRKLRAGAYRITLVLKDAAGNKSAPKVLNFKLA